MIQIKVTKPQSCEGLHLVLFIQYLETFLLEICLYTLVPLFILYRSKEDYYQIWTVRKLVNRAPRDSDFWFIQIYSKSTF